MSTSEEELTTSHCRMYVLGLTINVCRENYSKEIQMEVDMLADRSTV